MNIQQISDRSDLFHLINNGLNYLSNPLHFRTQSSNGTNRIEDAYGFGNIGSLGELLSYLGNPIFSLAAVAVVFYFIIGAVKYMSSGGDKGAISAARAMIIHSIIGFILLIIVFILSKYIPQQLGVGGTAIK